MFFSIKFRFGIIVRLGWRTNQRTGVHVLDGKKPLIEWLLIINAIGLAFNLFSNFEGYLKFVGLFRSLVDHWREWINWFWSYLFSILGIDFVFTELEEKFATSIILFSSLFLGTAVRSYFFKSEPMKIGYFSVRGRQMVRGLLGVSAIGLIMFSMISGVIPSGKDFSSTDELYVLDFRWAVAVIGGIIFVASIAAHGLTVSIDPRFHPKSSGYAALAKPAVAIWIGVIFVSCMYVLSLIIEAAPPIPSH